jgi:hypothetical protein
LKRSLIVVLITNIFYLLSEAAIDANMTPSANMTPAAKELARSGKPKDAPQAESPPWERDQQFWTGVVLHLVNMRGEEDTVAALIGMHQDNVPDLDLAKDRPARIVTEAGVDT